MAEEAEINIFKCLDFIRDQAPAYAKAKAERVYLEEFRKSKKAILMRSAEEAGHKSAAAQEREAYAAQDYHELLLALSAAVEAEETLRWRIVAAQARIETWRTLESTRRIEAKTL
jgi:hypothetical protein